MSRSWDSFSEELDRLNHSLTYDPSTKPSQTYENQ